MPQHSSQILRVYRGAAWTPVGFLGGWDGRARVAYGQAVESLLLVHHNLWLQLGTCTMQASSCFDEVSKFDYCLAVVNPISMVHSGFFLNPAHDLTLGEN